MKRKLTVFWAAVVVAMGLLLGASTTQAATVDLEGATAVRINNLDVNGTFYNVTFTAGTWADAYGGQPPQLDVTPETAPDFIEEINKALTISQARTVGEPGATEDAGLYMIAYAWDESEEFWVSWFGGFYADSFEDGAWISQIDGNIFGGDYPGDSGSVWANITQVEDAPPGQATLISPSGTITESNPTYTWKEVGTSTWYFLKVSDSAGEVYRWYTLDEACGEGTGECSVTPDIVLADGSYNWRIRAWNEFGLGPWSDALSFNVDTTGTEPPGVNVETDGNGNVTRITNLPVVNETTEETIIYNVDFVYDTATNVYGSGLVTDFPPPDGDETIFLALEAVMGALNSADPTPPAAGPQGTDQFFIGYKEDSGLIVAVGGENFLGVWDQCDPTAPLDGVECLAGVAVLFPGDSFTYGDFTVAD